MAKNKAKIKCAECFDTGVIGFGEDCPCGASEPTMPEYVELRRDIEVRVKLLNDEATVPDYAKHGDAGFDLYATHDAFISPGVTMVVKTGLAFEIPEGYEMQVRPRSGMSLKTKLRVANAPGTIDSGYRGEVGVILDNIGEMPYEVRKGDRIAQGVIVPVMRASFEVVDELSETDRGEGGYGSTGMRKE